MDATAFNKSKLSFRHVIEVPSRAPHRFHPAAVGLSEAIHRFLVGVGANRKDPCNIAPMRQAQSANRLFAAADGMPRQLCTALADGIAANVDWLAVTGTTAKRTLENVKSDWDQEVVCPIAHPISAAGVVVGLQGTRVLEGALVKVVGMTRLQFRRPARVFGSEESCSQAVVSRAYKAEGGPIGLVRGGDRTALDAEQGTLDFEGTLDLEVSHAGLARGRKPWKAPAHAYQSGTVQNCADQIGPAGAGAQAGSRAEVVCYADI